MNAWPPQQILLESLPAMADLNNFSDPNSTLT
jgi:hypothetical protein